MGKHPLEGDVFVHPFSKNQKIFQIFFPKADVSRPPRRFPRFHLTPLPLFAILNSR
nr:MAG TPA: hypothetical protein [Caudoviricetes sp.]